MDRDISEQMRSKKENAGEQLLAELKRRIAEQERLIDEVRSMLRNIVDLETKLVDEIEPDSLEDSPKTVLRRSTVHAHENVRVPCQPRRLRSAHMPVNYVVRVGCFH